MLFLNWKHIEARVFWNYAEGEDVNNAAYLGQSLLPAFFAYNDVVDGEVQYIGKFETGPSIQHDLHIGAEYRLKAVRWTYQAQDEIENHVGLFLHDGVTLGPQFAVIGDYRADYVPYLRRVVQSPRGSVLYHPTKKSTVRAVVATAFRTPTFLESYYYAPIQLPITGATATAFGAPGHPSSAVRLQPEQILTTELGYLNSDSDYLTFDSSLFYNHVNNLIDIAPQLPVTVGDTVTRNVGADPSTGLYPLFIGGFENACQKFNVYGAVVGGRTLPVE